MARSITELPSVVNTIAKEIISSIRKEKLEQEIKATVLANSLSMNSLPVDYIVFERDKREVSVQIVQPGLDVVLYCIDRDTNYHIFTNSVDEAIDFIINKI